MGNVKGIAFLGKNRLDEGEMKLMTLDDWKLMTAGERKWRFENWLVKKGGGDILPSTRKTYISAINKFQKELLGIKNFYECDISLIEKVKENDEDFFGLLGKSAPAASSAIEKYRMLWMSLSDDGKNKSVPAKGAILHKATKKT